MPELAAEAEMGDADFLLTDGRADDPMDAGLLDDDDNLLDNLIQDSPLLANEAARMTVPLLRDEDSAADNKKM